MRERLLHLIAEVLPVQDLDCFRSTLLEAVRGVVDADWISINEVGPGAQVKAIALPALDDAALEAFFRTAETNPLVRWFQDSRDGRVLRFSDLVTPDELHETRVWQEFYGPLEIEHQLAFVLALDPERMMAIALCRRADKPDFSDSERDLLNEARPYLIEAYRNAIEYDRVLAQLSERPTLPLRELSMFGLTPRERDVLLLVAAGRTNAHAAEELGIGPATVKAHLRHGYRKLGVRSRSDAARLLWGATGRS